ncbi:MAG: STAS domain-containing protein [Bacillota bacterium]|nr:STAS domain-containing protein [Bacillota bacterium]
MIEKHGIVNRVLLDAKLTVDKVEVIRKELYSKLAKGEKHYIIDFSKCEFIDSTGLGLLLSFLKRTIDAGGKLILCSLISPNVKEIFNLTRLDLVFTIEGDFSSALRKIN